MDVVHSGISDTGRGHGCPCGRVHPHQQGRRRLIRRPVAHSDLSARVYDATVSKRAERGEDGRWIVNYAGNCERPLPVPSHASRGALLVTYLTRCRRCRACLRARQFYWAKLGAARTVETRDAGLRTWFGTLTFQPEYQAIFHQQAMLRWGEENGGVIPRWWDDPKCDERFRFVRKEMLREVQKYWKRLRKGVSRCTKCYPAKPRADGEWDHPPASFKYLLVFERHKSGLPHVHWLLHEETAAILKKNLECMWPYGFVKMKLVKGDDFDKAAYYVAKYLGKSIQARQAVSLGYAKLPKSRPNDIESDRRK